MLPGTSVGGVEKAVCTAYESNRASDVGKEAAFCRRRNGGILVWFTSDERT